MVSSGLPNFPRVLTKYSPSNRSNAFLRYSIRAVSYLGIHQFFFPIPRIFPAPRQFISRRVPPLGQAFLWRDANIIRSRLLCPVRAPAVPRSLYTHKAIRVLDMSWGSILRKRLSGDFFLMAATHSRSPHNRARKVSAEF